MNERIKLPAQEWLGYDPERGDLHGYTFEQMREFAELIIKQCCNVVDAQNYYVYSGDVKKLILERFGIEA